MCDALHTDELAPTSAVSAGRSRAPLGCPLPSPGTDRAIAHQDGILHAAHFEQRRAD